MEEFEKKILEISEKDSKYLRITSVISAVVGCLIGIMVLILIVSVICVTIHSCTADAADCETWYVVSRDGLNCRTAPTTEAEAITVYPYQTPLQIIGIDTSGEWWETYDGVIQGWCNKNYLADDPNANVKSEFRYHGIGEYIGDFTLTHYIPDPRENGGYNTTFRGDILTEVVDLAVAVDPNVIPLDQKICIEGIGFRTARDTGGAIKGNKIDILSWYCDMSFDIHAPHKVYLAY